MFATGRLKTWITAGAGSIAALLVAGLLGAFGALPKPPVPDLPADVAIDAGQWRVSPIRAYVSPKGVYGVPLKQDQKALVLEVDMTNRTAESSKDYFNVFQPAGQITGTGDQVFVALTRDSTLSPELHPALIERMAYVWPLPRQQAVPARLPFAVSAEIFKPRDNLYGVPGWYNPHVLGTVTLPVGNARDAGAGT
jgi:hypothetical protein